MRDELPAPRLPLAVALMSATLAIGSGLGLPLAGFIAQNADWHALFWVTGGASAAVLVLVFAFVPRSPVRAGGTFDYRGALVLAVALVALMLALTMGGQWGWGSRATLLCAVGGAAVLAMWIPLELRTRGPLVDLRVAGRPALLLVNFGTLLVGFGMYANSLVATQMLQAPTATGYGHGVDSATAGWLLAPSSLAFAVFAPVSAAITRRFGAPVTLATGSVVMAFAYAARLVLGDDVVWIVAGTLVLSAGASAAFGAMPALVMRFVPRAETTSANGLNSLMRSTGISTSSAVVAAVFTVGAVQIHDTTYPGIQGLTLVLWVATGVCLVAAAVILPLILRRDLMDRSDGDSADAASSETAARQPTRSGACSG